MLTLVIGSPPPGVQPDLLGTDADLLGHDEGADDLRLGQQHDELVAAVAVGASRRCGSSRGSPRPSARSTSSPRRWPALSLMRLQAVEVDHQHAEAAVAATRPADLLLEGDEQLRAVEEAGQGIGARQVDDALHARVAGGCG